jgi:hypothetical protein
MYIAFIVKISKKLNKIIHTIIIMHFLILNLNKFWN